MLKSEHKYTLDSQAVERSTAYGMREALVLRLRDTFLVTSGHTQPTLQG